MSVFATVIGGIAVVAVWSLNAQNLELREEVGVCNIYSAQLISELRRLEVNPGLVDKIEKELINE